MASAIEYAILSTRTYPRTQKNITNLPEGWKVLVKGTNNSPLGFSASAYIKGTEIVIAYTGTNESKIADTAFANYPAFVGDFAPQVIEAMLFFLEIEKQYANGIYTVSFTGHSLGGGLASLMGMFFDKQATAFDPAPFQATLKNHDTLIKYKNWMKEIANINDERFNALVSDIPGVGQDIYGERNAGIFYYYLQGEFLNWLRFDRTNIGTLWWTVGQGKQSTSGLTTAFDLHSMSLLTALLKSEKLEEMGNKVDDSFAPFFDTKMYAVDPAEAFEVNFLDKLLNAQIGNLTEGVQPIMLLDKYATDMLKLQGDKGVAQTKLRKELFSVAGDYYYKKEAAEITKVFTAGIGSIQFDYGEFGTSNLKSRPKLQKAVEDLLGASVEKSALGNGLNNQAIWNIQEGAGQMLWVGTVKDDFALGGDQNDLLIGGLGNDILAGGDGKDRLSGGSGTNVLLGGLSYDTYLLSSGAKDTIADRDRLGQITMDGKKLTGGFREQGQSVYWNHEKTISYQWGGTELQISGGGGINVTVKNFLNGSLDIVLIERKKPEPGPDPSPQPPTYRPRSGAFIVRWDPLVFDLDHNGKIDTISSKASKAYFDFNADNIAEKCGWIAPEDGLLSIDLNGNGVVDGLSELFGSAQTSGFVDLKQRLDNNGDNVVDIHDSGFMALRVWRDLNGDGISQQGELATLMQLGISSIALASTSAHIEAEDNLISAISTFQQNGQLQLVADIELVVDFSQTDTNPTRSIDVSPIFDDEVYSLPELSGYGLVKNLHQAMQDDASLRSMASDFVSKGSLYSLENFSLFIKRWSGLEAIHLSKNIEKANLTVEDKAWILETLIGQNVFKSQIENANFDLIAPIDAGEWNAVYINEHFNRFVSRSANAFALQIATSEWLLGVVYSSEGEELLVADSFLAQESLVSYLLACVNQSEINFGISVLLALKNSELELDVNAFKQTISGSIYSELIERALDFSGTNYAVIGINQLGKFESETTAALFALGSKEADNIVGSAKSDFVMGYGGNDLIFGKVGGDTIDGGDGDDVLFGDGDSDLIIGGGGTDSIYGGDNDDFLNGGDGDDKLYGDAGLDVIDAGSGNDWAEGGEGNDQIHGGDGSDNLRGDAGNDVIFGDAGDDALLGQEGDDSLIGGAGIDYLSGGEGNDSLDGGADRDELYGDVGNDLLVAGAGDDRLDGGGGNDTLDGGAGTDLLLGGLGNDTYYWGRGSGRDSISNDDATIGRKDIIKIGSGILPIDISVSNTNFYHHVELKIKGTTDTLTIYRGLDPAYKDAWIDEIRFEDGTVWTSSDLLALSLIGTDDNDVITGYDSHDFIQGSAGNDTLDGGVGNDTLDGGSGSDSLSGGLGDDTYIFGISSGNDTIVEALNLDRYDTNIVKFESGVTPADVCFTMLEPGDTPSTLLVTVGNAGNTLSVNNFFFSVPLSDGKQSRQIAQFEFADGNIITADQIRQKLMLAQVTSGNDVIHGFGGVDILDGGAGDDTINGYQGADIYQFGRHSGNDTFYEDDVNPGHDENVILLDADVSPNDVTLKRDPFAQSDVLLSIAGTTNLLRLKLYLSDGHYLGKIKFSDGTTWNLNEVVKRLNRGTTDADLIVGTDLDETFDGLAGDDRIEGGAGGDTYLFDRTSGNDTILDRGDVRIFNNSDKVQLGAGILPSDVQLKRLSSTTPDDILLSVAGSNSTLRIESGLVQEYNGSFNYAIETIQFADGTTWNWETIKQKINQGTSADDILNGFTTSNDVLDGAGGNDRMAGYDGSDTYVFGRSYGDDFVEDYDQAGFGSENDVDVIKLGAGILPEDILVSKDSNESLILTIQGTTDKLTIYRYFEKPVWANGASPFQIEKIQFENGTVWDYNGVLASFMRGTNSDDNIFGADTDDTINGLNGNDLVFGAGGNDRLFGGEGDDTVVGGDGDDVIDGNSGNDELRGGDGYDQFIFGRQSGNDLINDGDNENVTRRDRIVLDADIRPSDINLRRDGTGSNVGLVISIAGSSSTLKIYPYFYGTELNPSMRQEIQFADGTVWNADQIKILSTPVPNRAPVVAEAIVDQAAKQNILFSFVVPDTAFADPDVADVLTYSASLPSGAALPSWLKFNASTKMFSGTPAALGTVSVKVTVKDKENLSVADTFDIVVGSANQVINGTTAADNLVGNVGNDTLTGLSGNDSLSGGRGNDIYVFNRGDGQDSVDNLDLLTATDTLRFATGVIDTDVLAFKSGNHLVFKLKNSTDQVMIGNYYAANTTINGQAADYKIDKVEFSNAVSWNQTMIQTMVDRATNNKAPTLGTAVPNQNSKVDLAYSFTVPVNTIVDTDVGDTVTYSLKMQDGSALPTWLSFNATTRVISGTPSLSNLGSLSLTLWGTDNYGTALGQNLSMTVNPANRAPVVAVNVPDQIANQGAAFNYVIPSASFSDPDVGDVLMYSATLADGTALPSWLTLNATTGAFSGTPISVGTLSIKVTAKDSGNLSISDVFDLTVNVANLTLNGTANADTLTGGAGNDTLSGLAGNDKLTGNAGNDSLDGGAGSDTLIGGLGDDIYIVDATTDVVTENANEGSDTIKSSVTLTLATNVENLTLTGTTAINGTGNVLNNVLTGNSAINTLDGGVGADTLAGAAGNDIYTVDNINDVIVENASEGTDQVNSSVSFTLSVNVENLTLTGTTNTNATGNAAVNTLTGNAGNNVLDGGAGNDSMVGGAGNDTYVVDSSGDIVTEAASAGTDLVQSSVNYTLGTNLENLALTGSANINATGNTAANILFGNSGNNILDGGTGADAMSGGAGNDIYVLDNAGDVITENASEGIDQVKSSLTYTLIANLEALLLTGTAAINGTGNALDNLLTGNSAKNILNGGVGNDILQGVAGDDTLTDTAGNNIFDGGAGIDVITAGVGNDFIVGGLGNDTINTSTGADVIAFNRGDGMDLINSSTGKDNTLSLGKGIKYADLLFKKSGNDLILVTGTSEQVTMKDWYANVNNRSIANLQVVIEGTTDYNAASTNKLNNKKIEQFNFDGLVTKFDQARAANPSLTSWALSASLLEFYLNSSDTTSMGGDLAYQYAKTGNLSAFSMMPAQTLLVSPQFGTTNQALQASAALQDSTVRLV